MIKRKTVQEHAILISGASRGIGLAIAKEFALQGKRILLVARNRKGLLHAQKEINSFGGNASIHSIDVTKENEVQNLFSDIGHLNELDVLINNAGLLQLSKRFVEMSLDEWKRTFVGNVTSTFLCSQYFAKMLIKRKRNGVIINTGSRGARNIKDFSPYCMAKSYLEMLTKQMAADLYAKNICVNLVVPPFTDTPGVRHLNLPKEKFSRSYNANAFSDLYLFLASEEGREYTGRIIDAETWIKNRYQALHCKHNTWKLKRIEHSTASDMIFNMGINPLGPSPEIVKELKKECTLENVSKYPINAKIELVDIIAQKHNVSKDNVILGNGSVEIIDLVIETFSETNSELISTEPGFSQIKNMCLCAGINCIEKPLLWENEKRWGEPDLESIIDEITSNTRIIYIINPQTPTGSVIDTKDFMQFLIQLPKRIILIVDEVYHEYIPNHALIIDTIEKMQEYPNLISIRSFSKVYGLAGMRVGYGIANENIVEALKKRQKPFTTSSLSISAAQLAMKNDDWILNSRSMISNQRQWLGTALCEFGIKIMPSFTTRVILKYFDDDFEQLANFLHSKSVPIIRCKDIPNAFVFSIGNRNVNSLVVESIKEYKTMRDFDEK